MCMEAGYKQQVIYRSRVEIEVELCSRNENRVLVVHETHIFSTLVVLSNVPGKDHFSCKYTPRIKAACS